MSQIKSSNRFAGLTDEYIPEQTINETPINDYKKIKWYKNSCYFSVSMWLLWTIIPFRKFIFDYEGVHDGFLAIKELFEKFANPEIMEPIIIEDVYLRIFIAFIAPNYRDVEFGDIESADRLIRIILNSEEILYNEELLNKIKITNIIDTKCNSELNPRPEIKKTIYPILEGINSVDFKKIFEPEIVNYDIDRCRDLGLDPDTNGQKIEQNIITENTEYFILNFVTPTSYSDIKKIKHNGRKYILKSVAIHKGIHYKCLVFDDNGNNPFELDDIDLIKNSNTELIQNLNKIKFIPVVALYKLCVNDIDDIDDIDDIGSDVQSDIMERTEKDSVKDTIKDSKKDTQFWGDVKDIIWGDYSENDLEDTESISHKGVSDININSQIIIPIKKYIPIEPFNGEILNSEQINNKQLYLTYKIYLQENKFYTIVLKIPVNIIGNIQVQNFFGELVNIFLSSIKFNREFITNDEYYPEMFTFLLGEYLKLISDDLDFHTEIIDKSRNMVEYKDLVKKNSNKLNEYMGDCLKYGLRIDNSLEINKRKFTFNLMSSLIRPTYNILDKYKPTKIYEQKLLKDLVYSDKFNFKVITQSNKKDEEDKTTTKIVIIPDKRKGKYNKKLYDDDFKSNVLSLSDYGFLYNYSISEKINIQNDFNFIINWIYKTFCKLFLNEKVKETINGKEKIKTEDLTSNDYKKLNEYYESQKNKELFEPHKKSSENFIRGQIQQNNQKDYQRLFYLKWEQLLIYFNNFIKYYYDDLYYNYLEDKTESLSHCVQNFMSNKSITNNDNDDPSNFRYLFLYCLMSEQQSIKLEHIYKEYSDDKKNCILKISKLKQHLFSYLKYVQKLNELNTKCILEIKWGSPFLIYCNNYFSNIIDFYNRDKLSFPLEYECQEDIELFKNLIITLVNSKIINHVYESLGLEDINEIFLDGIESFIKFQYEKIYVEKSINLYDIDIINELYNNLFSCLADEIKKNNTNDNDELLSYLEHKIRLLSEMKNDKIPFRSFNLNLRTCKNIPNYELSIPAMEKYKSNIIEIIDNHDTEEEIIDNHDTEKETIGKITFPKIDNFNINIDGRFSLIVKKCFDKIINIIYNNHFFDLVKIIRKIDVYKKYPENFRIKNIKGTETKDLDKFKYYSEIELNKMITYRQNDFDKNPKEFYCDEKTISEIVQENIIKELNRNDICIKVDFYSKGTIEINLSYKYFIPNKLDQKDSTLGENIITIIAFKYNQQEFIEHLMDIILEYKDKYSDNNLIKENYNHEKFIQEFTLFVNNGLNEIMNNYLEEDKINPSSEEVLNSLVEFVVAEFKKPKSIKINGTDKQIYLNEENLKSEYDKVVYYLEKCVEINELINYFTETDIELGIHTMIQEIGIIPIQDPAKDKTFCSIFTKELVYQLNSTIIKPDGIVIKTDEFDKIKINEYINMKIIIDYFLTKYNKELVRLDQDYLQECFNLLFIIYSKPEETVKLTQDKNIYETIYGDVKRYYYIMDELINKIIQNKPEGKFEKILAQYTEEDNHKIIDKMIELMLTNPEINIENKYRDKTGKMVDKSIKFNIYTNATEYNLLQLFSYFKNFYRIKEKKQELQPQPQSQTQVPLNKISKDLEKQVKKSLQSKIQINGTNITIDVKTDKINGNSLFETIKYYLENCQEIETILNYYYPGQIQKNINELIVFYEDRLISFSKDSFCQDFTNNLLCIIMRDIVYQDYSFDEIKIEQKFFKVWIDKYINLGILILNFFRYSSLSTFKLKKEIFIQDAINFIGEMYSKKSVEELKSEFENKNRFDTIFFEDIERYLYIKKCLDEYYQTRFYEKNLRGKYSDLDNEIIEYEIINLFMSYDNINIPYKFRGQQTTIIINVYDLIEMKRCPENEDITKLINHFTIENKIQPIPEQKISHGTLEESIEYNKELKQFIIPEKYRDYYINKDLRDPSSPSNIYECLDSYLNIRDYFKREMLKKYSLEKIIQAINIMGNKLINYQELPDKFSKLKRQQCYHRELTELFEEIIDTLKTPVQKVSASSQKQIAPTLPISTKSSTKPLTKPLTQSTEPHIKYDSINSTFIVPSKYNYTIEQQNPTDPSNLKECLDKFINENSAILSQYNNTLKNKILNEMGKKLENLDTLPQLIDRNGKDISYQLKKYRCHGLALRLLFTHTKDELGIR